MSEHHIEEQQNELEALRSIFFDEFSEPELSTDPPSFHLLVRMDGYYGSGQVPEYSLFVQYTRDYPDTIPIMRIEAAVGLDEEDEVAHLQRLLVESAESQLGMAMVFGVHAAAKETLETYITERDERREAERVARIEAEDAAERAKYAGTKVTSEAFLTWRTTFLHESATEEKKAALAAVGGANSAGAKALQRAEANKGKVSGRALFEKDKSLARSDITLMAEGDVAVDSTLFEGQMDGLDEDEEEEEENAVLAGFNEDDD
ncbi:ubiquitin-conjugating enzyme/RWD-like protein [Chytriomyces cf. hyalinus JEL632]|nr:ubiquitin-conjugating enzyme/RWD-like protein [Chytriomyces cf. hyalinus JEL632]